MIVTCTMDSTTIRFQCAIYSDIYVESIIESALYYGMGISLKLFNTCGICSEENTFKNPPPHPCIRLGRKIVSIQY